MLLLRLAAAAVLRLCGDPAALGLLRGAVEFVWVPAETVLFDGRAEIPGPFVGQRHRPPEPFGQG